VLTDSKGSIVPIYRNANSLDGAIEDVNGDGVLDMVERWGIKMTANSPVTGVLHVIPITPEQQPSFRVAINGRDSSEPWDWQLVMAPPSRRQIDGFKVSESQMRWEIQLGPKNEVTGTISPKAKFQWSGVDNDYFGPAGGPGKGFMRLKTTGNDEIAAFSAAMDLKPTDNN
jgi:hypothetical protein